MTYLRRVIAVGKLLRLLLVPTECPSVGLAGGFGGGVVPVVINGTASRR
jgi:hypothetical protein